MLFVHPLPVHCLIEQVFMEMVAKCRLGFTNAKEATSGKLNAVEEVGRHFGNLQRSHHLSHLLILTPSCLLQILLPLQLLASFIPPHSNHPFLRYLTLPLQELQYLSLYRLPRTSPVLPSKRCSCAPPLI